MPDGSDAGWRSDGEPDAPGVALPGGSRIKNTGTVTLDNPDRTIPYTDQFTAGYERQLWANLSVSADYVHTRAVISSCCAI